LIQFTAQIIMKLSTKHYYFLPSKKQTEYSGKLH